MKNILIIALLIGLPGCIDSDAEVNARKCHALFDELYDTSSKTNEINRELIQLLQTELADARKETIELQIEVNELRNFKLMLEDMKEHS